MKFIKQFSTFLLCAVLVLAPVSCVGPVPLAQGNAMKTEIGAQVKAGDISPELGAFLIAQIDERMDPNYSGGIDWDLVVKSGGGILFAVISSVLGVRVTRGPAKPMDKSQADLLKELVSEFAAKKKDDAQQSLLQPPANESV